MKIKKNLIFLIIFINILTPYVTADDEPQELELNILPSEKYKLNKRDLGNLKSDLERQVIIHIYNIS
jgi:hypothetical protein